MSGEIMAGVMFLATLLLLLFGFPVALTLGGVSLLFAFLGEHLGLFNDAMLNVYPLRVLGVMKSETLVAVPLFIFMGVMLERSNIASGLLQSMGRMFGRLPGGLGLSVVFVGALLASSTGIVGATVVAMGLISLPAMMQARYSPSLASGIICASGTLGQIIPPSIVLVLLGDILQGVNEQAAQLRGILVPEPVTAIDLFAGALLPGLLLVLLYSLWILLQAFLRPESCPALVGGNDATAVGGDATAPGLIQVVLPPVLLITAVLGSILLGLATPTESAAVGAIGASILAWRAGNLSLAVVRDVARSTTQISSMVFIILVGASMFSLVFRGFQGDVWVEQMLRTLPGGPIGAMLVVMTVIFLLGFFLDFIEIIFVVVPIVGPALIAMGYDPLWLGVMIAVNLQTSFLTPPFGFALFYLRGVASDSLRTLDIYRGVVPFILIQLASLLVLAEFPQLATWLPKVLYAD
jgi:tripartite ATP-independent transporter DctM subunit